MESLKKAVNFQEAGMWLIIGLICLLPLKTLAGSAFFDTSAVKSHVSIIPYIEYMADLQGNTDIETELSGSFQPLTNGSPLTCKGDIWLRFTLSPISETAHKEELFLDLGSDTPKGSVLYYPQINDNDDEKPSIWQERTAESNGLFRLPTPSQIFPLTVYVHIPGPLGPGFNPTVKTALATNSSGENIFFCFSISVLAVIFVICLLNAFKYGEEWRLWTAVFIALILAQSIMHMLNIPLLPNGYISFPGLLNIILHALSLMLQPYIAKKLIISSSRYHTMEKYDKPMATALTALSIAGGLICLIPFLPGCSNIIQLLHLWPIWGTICAVPTLLFLKRTQTAINNFIVNNNFYLGLWIFKRTLAKLYAWGCILLSIFSLISLLGTNNIFPASMFSAAPVWGGIVFALLVGILPMKLENVYFRRYKEEEKKWHALQLNGLPDENSSPAQDTNKNAAVRRWNPGEKSLHIEGEKSNNQNVSSGKKFFKSEDNINTNDNDLNWCLLLTNIEDDMPTATIESDTQPSQNPGKAKTASNNVIPNYTFYAGLNNESNNMDSPAWSRRLPGRVISVAQKKESRKKSLHMEEKESNNQDVSLEKNLSMSEENITTDVTDPGSQRFKNPNKNYDKNKTIRNNVISNYILYGCIKKLTYGRFNYGPVRPFSYKWTKGKKTNTL